MQVVQHLMAVIGTHGNRPQVARPTAALLFRQNNLDHADHIDVARQMRRFMEAGRVCLAFRGAQMDKVNAVGIGFRHLNQRVVGTHAIGAGTETETVVQTVHGFFQPLHIFLRRNNARQTQNRTWWVIRMHRQFNARFLRNRHDGAQEGRHMLAQFRFVDAVILRQLRLKLLQGVTLFGAWQTGDNIAHQGAFLFCAHGGKALSGGLLLGSAVILFRSRTLQQIKLEGRKSVGVEAQRFCAIRQRPGEVGSRPVQHRHEVVADGINAAGSQIAYRLLIIGDIAKVVTTLGFNRLMDRDALYHRPDQTFFRQQCLTRFNLLNRPYLAVRDMVQRRHNAGRARLTRIIQ